MAHAGDKPIAVLIPVWNRQAKLERALGSLLAEAGLLKVLVIDDGSEPPIRLPALPPLDVHVIRLPSHQGVAHALNAGLEYAFEQGVPYIARLDSDDIALEGRFRRQFDFMERNDSIGVCGTGYHEYSPDGRLLATVRPPSGDAAIRQGMHLRTTLWHPTVMIRTTVARSVGFFDPAFRCEDIDYFLRVLDVSRAANLPEPLIRYETGATDALTGTASRRRALARDLLRLKWRRREPLNPLWWLGLLATTAYFTGCNRHLTALRDVFMRLLERGGP
jgi:GT2 family glycosyltransferase